MKNLGSFGFIIPAPLWPLSVVLAAALGCSDDDNATDAGVLDAGTPDSGALDTGILDAGQPSSGCLTGETMDINLNNYFPEGIAIAEDGTAYVGSLLTGQIVEIADCSGQPAVFVPPMSGIDQAVGLTIDEVNNVVWACSSNILTDQNPGIVGFSRDDGSLVARHVFPVASGFCNDLVLDNEGNLYATDSRGGGIFVVDSDQLLTNEDAVSWYDDPLFDAGPNGETSLNGIAVDGSSLYVVNAEAQALYRLTIDGTGAPTEFTVVTLDRPLAGPDGIAVVDETTLAVVEGEERRLSLISLIGDSGTLSIVKDTGFQFPTTVALFGDRAWVIDSQFNRIMSGAQLPFQVFSVTLP